MVLQQPRKRPEPAPAQRGSACLGCLALVCWALVCLLAAARPAEAYIYGAADEERRRKALPDCPPPTRPANGYYTSCNKIDAGASCFGHCNPGYEGSPRILCGANATWFPTWLGTPCTAIVCKGDPPPFVLPGINVSAVFSNCGINGSTPVNGTCVGRCTVGSGRPTASCAFNNITGAAAWRSDVTTQCRPGCVGNPPLLSYSEGFTGLFTTCADFTPVNSTCTGACTNGVGTARAVCLPGVGGGAAWAPLSVNCAPLPPSAPGNCSTQPPGSPGDGTPWPDRCANVSAGFNCTTTCSGNFSQAAGGPPTVVCQGDGNWSTVVNSCVLIACATKPNGGVGVVDWPDSCANVSAGFTCTGNCSLYYISSAGGPPAVVCGADGEWSTINNTCTFGGSGTKHRRLAKADDDDGSDEPLLDDPDRSLHRALLLQTTGALPVDIKPVLTLPGGRPLVVAPMTIKDVDGDKTPAELAACLSAALVTVQEARLLNMQHTEQELEQQVQQHMEAGKLTAEHARHRVAAMAAAHAAAVAADDPTAAEVLRLLSSGGLFLSPMHVSSKSLKLQTLKDDLSRHFDSLVRLPKCLVAPFSLRQVLQRARQPGSPVGVDVSVRVSVVQARHPGLCEGVEGVRFTARILTSLTEVAEAQRSEPETSMWAFAGGSAAGDSCAALAQTVLDL